MGYKVNGKRENYCRVLLCAHAVQRLQINITYKTKNRLMVTDHSKDVPEILPLNRMTKFDFPPHFLVRLMHSFPMMYNTI